MVSGPDIITYIGVPLAVLGVMPIIYNTISTLLTLANVRRMLRHGHLAGIARGDVINHVIEVELPRYTIAPLHREEQCKEYWRLCDYPSLIPGGTWTTFNWKRHNTGLKTQRIDYSDQLRLPQAEIEFEELISFLLDLGAIPDATGFRMLRGSGLWVPTGTPLLVSPDRREPVLTIAPLDDSDGHLSLAVRWSSNWGMREPSSLPPYWVLIKGSPTLPPQPSTPAENSEGSEKNTIEDVAETSSPSLEMITSTSKPSMEKRTSTSKYTPIPEDPTPSIRCQISTTGLIQAIPNDTDPQLFAPLPINHLLCSSHLTTSGPGTWFASTLTALSTSTQTILWAYKIPPPLLKFTQTPSIPCGILVLLDIIPESLTPEWATQYDDQELERETTMRRMRELSRATLKENSMTPEARSIAVRERQMKQHEDFVSDLNERRRRETQRAETRIIEAIQSPKWDNILIASHCLSWLKSQGHIPDDQDLKRATEVLLWKMVVEPNFANEIAGVLEQWRTFVGEGGLKRVDYLGLLEKKVVWAKASLLVATVAGVSGSVGMGDLGECLRIWRRVRLG